MNRINIGYSLNGSFSALHVSTMWISDIRSRLLISAEMPEGHILTSSAKHCTSRMLGLLSVAKRRMLGIAQLLP